MFQCKFTKSSEIVERSRYVYGLDYIKSENNFGKVKKVFYFCNPAI